MKRSILLASLLFVCWGLTIGVSATLAQPYPNRTIQTIIPNVAGSIMDISSRALADEVGKILGTTIVPINKPGAATAVGTEALARSKNDGYTIGHSSNAMIYGKILNPESIRFDIEKDIEPIGMNLTLPLAVAVRADAPWKTFNELLDYAKKNPGSVRFNTIGIGSSAHFNIEIIQSLTGAQFTHIPFKGGESLITALLGKHLEMSFDAVNKFVPHLESGELKLLLLTNKMAAFPNVPILSELGFNQTLVYTWFAQYAPAGLPEEVKKKLIPAVEKVVKSPDYKSKFEQLKLVVEYKSPEEMKKLVGEEYRRGLEIAKKAGLGEKKN